MKDKISQMKSFPTKLADLKLIVQQLWDEMNSCMFIKEIEKTPEKLRAVIKARGLQTKY